MANDDSMRSVTVTSYGAWTPRAGTLQSMADDILEEIGGPATREEIEAMIQRAGEPDTSEAKLLHVELTVRILGDDDGD